MPYSPEDLLAMGTTGMEPRCRFRGVTRKIETTDVPPLKIADNVDRLDQRSSGERIADPQISRGAQHSYRPELGPALHAASNARVFACIARLRRNGRFHVTIALEGKLHSLCDRTFREARLLLARDSRRPAADHCSRRNSRALFSALSFLETRGPDPAALLRLRRE